MAWISTVGAVDMFGVAQVIALLLMPLVAFVASGIAAVLILRNVPE